MKYATIMVPAAAVRRKPRHQSEMINQLLFGESLALLKEKGDLWRNKLKEFGTKIDCGNGSPVVNIFSAKNSDKARFRHEDIENTDIHFDWEDYKVERILALSKTKFQRNELKKFPE